MAKCTGGFDDDVKCYKDGKVPLYKNKYFWIILIIITIFTVGVDKYKGDRDIRQEVSTIEKNYNREDFLTKDIEKVSTYFDKYDDILNNWQKLLLEIGNGKIDNNSIAERTELLKKDFRELYMYFDAVEIDNLKDEDLKSLADMKDKSKKACIDFSLAIDKLNKLTKNGQYNEKNQEQVKEYLKKSKTLIDESREIYNNLI